MADERPTPARSARKRRAGFSYVEVLVATVLIAVALVPAIESLHTASIASHAQEGLVEDHYALQARFAELEAESFADLDLAAQEAGDAVTPTSYSDALGTQRRRLVKIARYDLDRNAPVDWADGDYGLLWLRIEIEETSRGFETLVVP